MQTAWTIQIRMQTNSTAPKMFGQLAAAAKRAGGAVETTQKFISSLGETADKAAPQLSALAKASRGLGRAFTSTGKSADGFARTTRMAADSAKVNFDGLRVTLDGVRASAASTAAAVRAIANAARAIPKTVGSHGSASSGGMNPVTLGAAAGGALAGGMLVNGVGGASTLQGATLQAAVAMGRLGPNLGATTANMGDMSDIAFAMSKMTGQNISDSMGVIAAMSSAGVNATQLRAIYRPIAQFTDVLHFGKDHMDYAESAKLGAGLVHDMRLFNPADTSYGLSRIAQLGYLSPHGTNQLATQIRRMAPTLENVLPGTIQQKSDEIVKLAAWSDRMGNLPFAGSAISQMVTQMIMPRSKRVLKSMENLGVYDSKGRNNFWDERTGSMDVMGAVRRVQQTIEAGRKSGHAGAPIEAIFGNTQNTQRILSAFTSKEAIGAYNSLSKQMTDMGADPVAWLNRMQVQLMAQLSSQTQLLKSNFETLTTYIGQSMLPALTEFVKALANVTGNLAGFVKNHPTAARAAGVALGATAVAGGVASLVLGGYVAHGAFKGILHHIGNHALEGEIAGTAAEAVKVGGWRTLMSGGAKFVGGAVARGGGILRSATGMNAVESVRGFSGTARMMLGDLAKLGPQLLRTRAGFALIFETLAKLGIRAIPVVGEVVALVETIRFLGNNTFSIGKLIGMAARGLVDGLHSIWDAIVGLFKNVGWIATHPVQAVTGGVGGIIGWGVNSGKNLIKGVSAGWNANHPQPAQPKSNVIPFPAGGRNGGAHPKAHHGGVAVVRHSGKVEVALTGSSIDSMSAADKNRLADVIADKLAAKIARDTKYAHGGTQAVATDNYGGSSYHSEYGVPS